MTDDFVYVIQHVETASTDIFSDDRVIENWHGWHKIGVSKNPERRLATLRGGTPHKLRLLTTTSVEDDAERVEELLHRLHYPWDRCDEWFRLSPDGVSDLQEIESLSSVVLERVKKENRSGSLRELSLLEEVRNAREVLQNGE